MFGWLNRADANVVATLIAEKSINAELRAHLAAERARFDFLAQHVNELRIERGMLYARIGFDVPVPHIERAATDLPGAVDNYAPSTTSAQPANVGDVIARARAHKDTPQARTPITFDPRALFEDIGDDAAGALQIERDDFGALIESPTR